MSRWGPSDWSKTLHIPGDIHFPDVDRPSGFEHNGMWAFRQERMMLDLLHGALMGAPAATIHVGDVIEGLGLTQDAASKVRAYAWFGRLPWPWAFPVGNHDVEVGDTRTEWLSYWANKMTAPGATGLTSSNFAVNLGFVRVVFCDYRTSAGDLSAIATLLAADTATPTVFCEHKPLSGTNSTPSPRHGPESIPTGANLPGNEAGLKAAIDARANVKLLVCGHTHNNLDTPGLVTTTSVGARTIGHVNAGSPYFLGSTNPDSSYATRGAFGDQLYSLFLEMLDTDGHEWAVHARDHGSGRWTDFDGDLTKRLTV